MLITLKPVIILLLDIMLMVNNKERQEDLHKKIKN